MKTATAMFDDYQQRASDLCKCIARDIARIQALLGGTDYPRETWVLPPQRMRVAPLRAVYSGDIRVDKWKLDFSEPRSQMGVVYDEAIEPRRTRRYFARLYAALLGRDW